MPSISSRGTSQRIEAQMQRVLAALIAREVKDPRVGNVTITAVSVAADMASARIFFVPFASSNPPEQVASGSAHGRRLSARGARPPAGPAALPAAGVRLR